MRHEMRLKHVAQIAVSNVDKKSADDECPVRLCNYTDVYYNERITASLEFMTATASHSQIRDFRLRPGDVLITKDSETPDDIAVPAFVEESADDLVCGYHLALIRPDRQLVDSRFLFWTLAASSAKSWFSTQATGVTRFGLRAQSIADARLSLPPLVEQAEIAQYLDAEAARIDALIEKKRQMATLVSERLALQVESDLRAVTSDHGEIALRHLADVTVGIVVTPANYYVDDGVPALRGVNIAPGRIRLDDLVRISDEGHALHPKSQLRAGDVVTVRTGQAGATAVVPPSLVGANCIDLLITRPRPGLSPEFLELVINSDWCRKHIERHAVGAIQGHFNVGALKDLPIPHADLATQAELVDRFVALRERTDRLARALDGQVELLREHRQALITAAVTGQLDVAKAAA